MLGIPSPSGETPPVSVKLVDSNSVMKALQAAVDQTSQATFPVLNIEPEDVLDFNSISITKVNNAEKEDKEQAVDDAEDEDFESCSEQDDEFFDSDDKDTLLPTALEPAPTSKDTAAADLVIPAKKGDSASDKKAGKGWLGMLAGAVAGVEQVALSAAGTAIGKAKDGISHALAKGVSWGVQKVADKYAPSLNKDESIARARQSMLRAQDPHFVAFADIIRGMVVKTAEAWLGGLKSDDSVIDKNLKHHSQLVIDLVDINLANGFANLAKQTAEKRNEIADYDNQPSLVNVLTLFCQKGGAHLSQERFQGIEKKYRDDRAAFSKLKAKLFPTLEDDLKELELRKKLGSLTEVDAHRETGLQKEKELLSKIVREADCGARIHIENKLFPGVEDYDDETLHDVVEFRRLSEKLSQRHGELNKLFQELADDILVHLFPNRFKDFEMPSFLKVGIGDHSLVSVVYNRLFKGKLVELIQNSYESVEDDANKTEAWKKDLQSRLGAPDLASVIDAPSAFMLAFLKDFIQSNPKAITLTVDALNGLKGPTSGSKKSDKEAALDHLSQLQLANWVVESVQSMVHSADPALTGLGNFVDTALNNLALAFLAQGAKLAIPDGEKVEHDQFVKQLTDRLVAKASVLTDEPIAVEFWQDFVEELPLPAPLKGVVVPLAAKHAVKGQTFAKDKAEAYEQVKALYEETKQKVQGFKRGEELLSIADKVSEQIVDQLIEKNIGIVSDLGLGDSFDELLIQYLPGVKINEDLKNWFQENVSALGETQMNVSPKLVGLSKHIVEAVVLKGMVITIETNFKGDNEEYAAQLLDNIHKAFIKAINGFNEDKRKQLEEAFDIQKEIKTKKKEIEALRVEIAEKPEGLTAEQMQLIDETLEANMRFTRARDYVVDLDKMLETTLAKVNQLYKGDQPWAVEDLPFIAKALTLYTSKGGSAVSQEDLKAQVKKEIEQLQTQPQNQPFQQALAVENKIVILETLQDLLEMSAKELQLLAEAVIVHATVQRSEQEVKSLEIDLKAKRQAVEEHEQLKLKNRNEWDYAVAWLTEVLESRGRLHALSKEVTELNRELDAHLEIFQVLSFELTALLGLDQIEKLDLPDDLNEWVWPQIEATKKEHIARLLFEQLTPMILVTADKEANKARLKELSKGDDFLVRVAEYSAAETMENLPDLVTNYSPFAAEILQIFSIDHPTPEEIEKMEEALRLVMLDSGRQGVEAAMIEPVIEGCVPPGKEEAMNELLRQWIDLADEDQLSAEKLFEMLTKAAGPFNQKDEKRWRKEAKHLAHGVNEFLISRGKRKLKPEDLLDAYQTFVSKSKGSYKPILTADTPGSLQALTEAKLVERIKRVIITHDEIAQLLNEIVPGAKDLHTLVAPQLEAVITGQQEAVIKNRKYIQDYLEGVLLRRFVKGAEANSKEGKDLMAVLASKVKALVPKAADLVGKSAEGVAQNIIDQVLKDVFVIESQDDLDGVPEVLRKVGYEKLKEQAYKHLTPILLPMIELHQNRAKLEHCSGSKFLGNVSEAVAKDFFMMLPFVVDSYRSLAIELFRFLAGKSPSPDEEEQFAQALAQMVQSNKKVPVDVNDLVQAYAETAQLSCTPEAKKEMAAKLEDEKLEKGKLGKGKALNRVLTVILTPEKVADEIGKLLPTMHPELLKKCAQALHSFLHGNGDTYKDFSGFAEAFVEGMLLRFSIGFAEKNPPQKGKDSFMVATERFLDYSAKKLAEAKSQPVADDAEAAAKQAEKLAQEINDWVKNELLPLESSQALNGLPDPLKQLLYDKIKNRLGQFLLSIHRGIATLDSDKQSKGKDEVVDDFVAVDTQAAVTQGLQTVLSEDLANLVMQSVPEALAEMGNHQMRGVNFVAKGLENYLEGLARGNFQLASVLLQYSKRDQLQQLLAGHLQHLADEKKSVDEKAKAAGLLANLVLKPLNGLHEMVVDFEQKKGAEFNRQLMANVLVVAAGHLKHLNGARQQAADQGRTDIQHRDFVAAAGKSLHPAVPVQRVDFDQTIQEITAIIQKGLNPAQKVHWAAEKENLRQAITRLAQEDANGTAILTLENIIREIDTIYVKVNSHSLGKTVTKLLKEPDVDGLTLRDLIRKEAEAPRLQRQKEAYAPVIQTVMKLIFPNGTEDLTFAPEELRGVVWKMLQKDLFPLLLPMLTELILSPDVINNLILSSLETMRDNLNGDIVPQRLDDSTKQPLDALDLASEALVGEMLKMVTLPDWIKNRAIDPKTGQVNESIVRALGSTLRNQFNGTFIKDKLNLALEKVVKRDAAGEYLLKPDTQSKADKAAKAADKREAVQKDLKRVSREVVNASISYFIRSTWVQAQLRFDELIEQAFGKMGTRLKKALDDAFRLIFFKLIGTALAVIFHPIRGYINEFIYKILHLDENRERILALLTKAPTDQPLTGGHVVYNEDLIFNMGEAVKNTVHAFMHEPILKASPPAAAAVA